MRGEGGANDMNADPLALRPLLVNSREAARMMSIGERALWRMAERGDANSREHRDQEERGERGGPGRDSQSDDPRQGGKQQGKATEGEELSRTNEVMEPWRRGCVRQRLYPLNRFARRPTRSPGRTRCTE